MFEHLVDEFSRPLYEVMSIGTRFSWVFLLSAAAIAIMVHRRNRTSRGEPWSLIEAIRATFPRNIFLHPSALLDYRYAVVNYALQVLAFGGLMLGVTQVAQGMIALLTAVLGPMPPDPVSPGLGMSALFGFLILLALDGGLFFAHWLMHRVPALWEFHKVHHSAEVLTPVTVLRMHPVDMIVNSLFTSLFIGLVNGVFFFFGYHLRHSHVWVMFPKGIREYVSSPALHLIHHSSDPKHWDKNFSRIFVFWDRLANSLYMPAEKEDLKFGIGNGQDGQFNTVYNLYVLPFVDAARRLRQPGAGGEAPQPAETQAAGREASESA
ncbi:MAG TPA: sterol desaturase family protein [Afifellaceae bacterium]|nr:sterol desaturase family protein [Afifellaceae bacterium]